MNDTKYEPESGACLTPATAPANREATVPGDAAQLIYVGDPMCSWCWGIAPDLRRLRQYCQQREVPFQVVVGGLRAGGGKPWNQQFRSFLAHHWQEIGKLTGQPFSYGILNWEVFEYDTEPACRSVVTARLLLPGSELSFFFAVQQRFYVGNEDPKRTGFYRDICAELELDFEAFAERFEAEETRTLTRADFRLSRNWGVRGFPSVLLRTNGNLVTIASGYSTFEKMQQRFDILLGPPD